MDIATTGKGSRYFGVPLDDLAAMLGQLGATISRATNGLSFAHPFGSTEVVITPAEPEGNGGDDLVAAVFAITRPTPKLVECIDGHASSLNRFATLGAITETEEGPCVISRVSVYSEHPAWNLFVPLLAIASFSGAISIVESMSGVFGKPKPPLAGEESEWTSDDFDRTCEKYSDHLVCNSGGLGFTAEFGLSKGEYSAMEGHRTALLVMRADEPNPYFGGGLLSTLRMPHSIPNQAELRRCVALLNESEARTGDLPPHFGAWCEAPDSTTLTYVSFLPNMLKLPHIEKNLVAWSLFRVQMAKAILLSAGHA